MFASSVILKYKIKRIKKKVKTSDEFPTSHCYFISSNFWLDGITHARLMVSFPQYRKVIKLQGIWERGCFLCRIISFLPQIFSTVKMQGMPLQPTLTFALLVFKDLNLNIREKCFSTAVAIVTFKEESSGHWKVGWNQEESIWGKRETGRRRKGCFKNGRSQKEVWGIRKKEVSHLRSTMDVML